VTLNSTEHEHEARTRVPNPITPVLKDKMTDDLHNAEKALPARVRKRIEENRAPRARIAIASPLPFELAAF
jgi:hypothetical protein